MEVATAPIVISDSSSEEDYVDVDSEDDCVAGLEESWSCAHCTTSNSGLSGDCAVCGLPRTPALDETAALAIVDLTEATEAYARNAQRRCSTSQLALDQCGCHVALQQPPCLATVSIKSKIIDCSSVLYNPEAALFRENFKAHVEKLASRLPKDINSLAMHFCCPSSSCTSLLTRRDILSVLDTEAAQQVDQRICTIFNAYHPFEGQKLKEAATRQAFRLATTIGDLQESMGLSRPEYRGAPEQNAGGSNLSHVNAALPKLPAAGTKRKEKEPQGSDQGAQGTAATPKAPAAKGAGKGRGKGKGAALGQQPEAASPTAGAASNGRDCSRGIAKGTGYGGENHHHNPFASPSSKAKRVCSTGTNESIWQAQQKEVARDQQTLIALEGVQRQIQQASGGAGLLQQCDMLACAVVFGSPLAFLLRRLLQNDSLMDIGCRSDLYWGVVRLIQTLGKCVDFVPLFLKPAADFNDTEPQHAPSMLDALKNLDTQCKVFKRNAEDLQSEEEIRALSLALEVSSLFEDLQKAAQVLEGLRGTKASAENSPEAMPSSGPDSQEAKEKEYCKAVAGYKLGQWPLLALQDFYFRTEAASGQGFAGRKSLLRLGQEMSSLSTSLPTALATSVFLVNDESRMDVLRACIIGPESTPYENGIFIFDILLPPDYPEKPPKFQFLTTGSGKVRFNPNLYESGKVCLSLLGTWAGPSWNPATSTLLQVLVSIQSMIFIDDPYFNEPGYERMAGTASGTKLSDVYNASIRRFTLQHALLPALQKPPPCFNEVLKIHFRLKRSAIIAQMDAWKKLDASLTYFANQISQAVEQYGP